VRTEGMGGIFVTCDVTPIICAQYCDVFGLGEEIHI